MSYLKSYFIAALKIAPWAGVACLATHLLSGDTSAFYYLYLTALAALGGPLQYHLSADKK